MRLAALVLALCPAAGGAAAPSLAPAHAQQKAQCSTCKDTGLVPCKACAKDPCKQKHEPRNYGLLTDLGTRPRTTYLGNVRNPNPELANG